MSSILQVTNVNQAFKEGWWKLRAEGVREESRNGPVLVYPGLFITEYTLPWERVLFNPVRDANPVFHLMEAIWMLAGRRDVKWLSQFNKNITSYAEKDGDIHGAYGYRWRNAFECDQIPQIIKILKKDPTSRQAVLSMWSPDLEDLVGAWKDRPCNTHAYFDLRAGKLNMTVCCRSNDMLWGAYGANAVHFSVLQEVIAHELSAPMGTYRQVSNNFHVYLDNVQVQNFLEHPPYESHDLYAKNFIDTISFMNEDETIEQLYRDCERLSSGSEESMHCLFMAKVAKPLCDAYLARKEGRKMDISVIEHCDWKLAFTQWIKRRNEK